MAKKKNKKSNETGQSATVRSRKKEKHADQVYIDVTLDNVVSVGVWPPMTEEQLGDGDVLAMYGQMFRGKLERYVLYQEMIFSVPNILTRDECEAWIKWSEGVGFLEAKHAATAGIAFRDNGRISVRDLDVAQTIFERVRKVVPEFVPDDQGNLTRRAVGCSSNIRVYRYFPGQRFGKHIDESCFEEESQAWSEFTLLFYLNKCEAGGETVFYKGSTGAKEVLRVETEPGSALLHWHGDRCLLHEGAPVRQGVKYLLRTDVLYR